MIDTSVLVAYERAQLKSQEDWRERVPAASVMAAVSVFELRLGALLGSPGRRRESRVRFLSDVRAIVPVLPFDAAAAEIMADLYVRLRRAGGLIGERDLQIAATALVAGHEVMTLNVSEFARIPELVLRPFEQA